MERKEKRNHTICTLDMCGDEKWIWFVDAMLNILYKVNICDKTFKSYPIPYEEKIQYGLYSRICKIRNEIWLIPLMAKRIIIFNSDDEGFSTIDIFNQKKQSEYLFCDAVVEQNVMYLFPCMFGEILKMDIHKKEVLKKYEIPSELRTKFCCGIEGVQKLGEAKFMASYVGTTELLEFDKKTGEFKKYGNDIGLEKESNMCFVSGSDYIYAVSNHPSDGTLRKMDDKIKKTLKSVPLKKGIAIPYIIWNQYIVIEYMDLPFVQIYDEELSLITEYEKEYNANLDHPYDRGVWTQITDKLVVYSENMYGKISFFKDGELEPYDSIVIEQDENILDTLLAKWWDIKEVPVKETEITDCRAFLNAVMRKTEGL